MLQKLFLSIAIIVIFLATGFSAATQAKPPAGMGQMPPTPVEAFKVQAINQNQQITATGSMRANQGVVLQPEDAGRVTAIYFKPGDNVAAGTKLIQLNQDVLLAELKQHEAELKLAQQTESRQALLLKTHAVAKVDFDKAMSDLRSTEAKKAMTLAKLKHMTIVAPFAGKVGLNLVNIGEYVIPGKDLVSLQAINPIEVEFGVPEVYLNKIAVGNTISLHSDVYPEKIFTGTVNGIDTKVSQDTRTIAVRASIPNPEGKLLPGVFGEVTLTLGAQKSVLSIPQTALVYEVGETYVYKIVEDKAVKTKVLLGARDQQNVIVANGLKAGDLIVTAGQLKINMSGQPVKAISIQ